MHGRATVTANARTNNSRDCSYPMARARVERPIGGDNACQTRSSRRSRCRSSTSQTRHRTLVVLGQIHPYHRIEEFVAALETQGNARPVLVIGGVGDDSLLARLSQKAQSLPWLTVQPGFADEAKLAPILEHTAAIVSLQRNTFNSGGPFYALPRELPIIMSSGAQASDIKDSAGDDWVYPVPDEVGSLDLANLERWLNRKRTKPTLERFAIDRIANAHIELYELLQS